MSSFICTFSKGFQQPLPSCGKRFRSSFSARAFDAHRSKSAVSSRRPLSSSEPPESIMNSLFGRPKLFSFSMNSCLSMFFLRKRPWRNP